MLVLCLSFLIGFIHVVLLVSEFDLISAFPVELRELEIN